MHLMNLPFPPFPTEKEKKNVPVMKTGYMALLINFRLNSFFI